MGGGRAVRRGAVVRADALDRLTARGWDALVAHGVRTAVDLRNDDELGADVSPRPPAVRTVRCPLDGVEDRAFWDVWSVVPAFGTPEYYAAWLRRFPERAVAAVRAVAWAEPGGVAVHCGLGRDRTGLVTLLLLSLLGAESAVISDDHALSDPAAARPEAIALAVDAAGVALAGLSADDRRALRARLL